MIPLKIPCDEYINWPKLTEQKKIVWVYNSSHPTKVRVGTIIRELIVVRTIKGKNAIGTGVINLLS